MPQTKSQRAVFALLTVIITVHVYVFYSLYVIHGVDFMARTNTGSVLATIDSMGGVMMLGTRRPIWALVAIGMMQACTQEMTIGSPLSFKLACKVFNPRSTHPVLFETAIISATVGVMCPAMSFIAAWLYYPYANGFNLLTLLADWLELVCFNFLFAWLSQLFFIQPLVRTLFKDLAAL